MLRPGERDVVGLRDEHHCERAVHHRTVEVERVAHRQHERGDLVRHAEFLEVREELRVGRLARRGGEGEDERFLDEIHEAADAAGAYEQGTDCHQKHPQAKQPQVEHQHELAVGDENTDALRGDRRRDSREDCDRGEQHHVAGDLEHHVGDTFDPLGQECALLPEGRQRHAEEDREHHDLQDLVVGHRLHRALGHEVGDELLQGERGRLEAGARARVREREVQVVTGLEQVHQHQAQQQRAERGADEPQQRLAADPADGGGVAHMRDADDEGREHQRRDDHLDQAQEDIGDEGDIACDLFRRLRIGPSDTACIAHGDAEDHADKDQGGEP